MATADEMMLDAIEGQPAYELRAKFTTERFFSGIIDPRAMASPTGPNRASVIRARIVRVA